MAAPLAWQILAGLLAAQTEPPVPRLAVLASVISDDEDAGDVETLALLRREAEAALRYVADVEVIPVAEIEAQLAPAIAYCRTDQACAQHHLEEARVGLVLEIVLNRALNLCSAELYEAGSRRSLAKGAETVRPSVPRAPLVGLLVDRLMSSSGRVIGGTLSLSIAPLDAVVALSPAPQRPSEDGRRFVLARGSYEIKVEREGYASAKSSVDIAPLRDAQVEIGLEPSSVVESPWFWTGVGLGAAAIATTIIAVVARGHTYYLCQAPDPSQCR